ncbi:MAG TPA: NAD(P)/FAD-dependent oxidoreductase [Calditrichia bacterium]|nr:FAD-dependent oxidoreductase [Calditrichota bacterium]HQU73517.1 NAD(P)/FAD-dependent oxidoreductase [Calditrichia bacterium]HQV33896.1 NAD(P)/FAD-dependent oxidoreductase [Calditrichia bacterium]
MSSAKEIIIVGGGAAGLCAAKQLQKRGVPYRLFEAEDRAGGRLKTDLQDGFRLDHGFQVLLTAYPECRAQLDYDKLNLKSFYPGALVHFEEEFHTLADPFRNPVEGLKSLFSKIGTFSDKFKVAALRKEVRKGSPAGLFERPEKPTYTYLEEKGFSQEMINRFFRPFFGGIFLEKNLLTSSRLFEFYYRMFSEGDIAVPEAGMGAIAAQLAAGLSPASLHFNTAIQEVTPHSVTPEFGDKIEAGAVILAVDGLAASKLLSGYPQPTFNATTCLYYAIDKVPLQVPTLILNGEGSGPVNNLAILSNVSPSYAPPGKGLISVSVIGDPLSSDAALDIKVRQQMAEWFGYDPDFFLHLKTYRIPRALPQPGSDVNLFSGLSVVREDGLVIAGDHLSAGSLHGAMRSGREAADLAIEMVS